MNEFMMDVYYTGAALGGLAGVAVGFQDNAAKQGDPRGFWFWGLIGFAVLAVGYPVGYELLK